MARRRVIDIGDAPLYRIPEAAFYMDIPVSTLRSWVSGRVYPTQHAPKFFHPLIDIADRQEQLLSFYNLVEAHVISTFRRHHNIPVPRIRDAMDYLRGRINHSHPLVTRDFYIFGRDLIVKELGIANDKVEVMVNTSQKGQLAFADVLKLYLKRIKRTATGFPQQISPLKKSLPLNQPEVIEIDPTVAFGQPVLKGTGVTIAMLLDRHHYGRTAQEIAKDYNLAEDEVESAIEYYQEAA